MTVARTALLRWPPRRWALAVLPVGAVIIGLLQRGQPWLIDHPLWELQNTVHIKRLLIKLMVGAIGTVGVYVILAGVVAWAASGLRRWRAAPLAGAAAAGAMLCALGSAAARSATAWPNRLDFVLPAVGAGIGAAMVWLVVHSDWTWRRRAVTAGAGLGMVGILAAMCGVLALSRQALAFDAAVLTSDERVRLTQLLRSRSPRLLPEGTTATLALTEHDINLLLSWGLSLGSRDRKARVVLDDATAAVQVSVGLPGAAVYLNAEARGSAGVEDGQLRVDLRSARLGRLSIPGPVLGWLARGVAARINHDPRARPILDAIHHTTMSTEAVAATYERMVLPDGFRNEVFGSVGPDDQVHAALVAQFERMVKIAEEDEPGFERFVRGAFDLAAARSATQDPIVENRAAVVALGICFGHPRVGEFIAAVPHEHIPAESMRLYRRSRLRGRVDWSRHFLVSAALAVVADEAVSSDIGLLKEEIDAGTAEGSGFSFADLAADRAGTHFGIMATLSDGNARITQDRLRGGFDVDDVFPPVADLREGLTAAELARDFDGVDGPRYRAVLADIDRRIGACRLYD